MQGGHQGSAEAEGEEGAGLTDIECDSLFDLYDMNDDGMLDHLEAVQMVKLIKGTDDVNPVKVMEAWDRDQNGQVRRD